MTSDRPATLGQRAADSVAAWEGEGGQLPLPDGGAAMLQRLGAALVLEWPNLPMPLQRAIYDRAVADDEGGLLKAEVARYLHDHHGPPAG